MQGIDITVRSKIAQVQGSPEIVCGNSDYTVSFDLDSEWNDVTGIVAQIAYIKDGQIVRENMPVSGGACSLPVISDAYEISVGLTGGNIRTAAPAVIACVPCITDFKGKPKAPVHDVYNEIMEAIANA